MKKTAVEFLVDNLEQNKFITKSQIHIAKEMEKQQIINAYIKGCADNYSIDIVEDAEQYYKETFKK